MNRRELIIGTGTALAVASFPAVAALATPTRSTMSYIEEIIRRYPSAELEMQSWIELNRNLVEGNDLFPPELQVPAPTFLYEEPGTKGLIAGTVKSRVFSCQYSMELAQDLKLIQGIDGEAELRALMVDEMEAEVRISQSKLKSLGQVMVSYMPVTPIRAIELDTWQPVIRFKTRYGVVPAGAKIFRGEIPGVHPGEAGV